MTITLNSIFKQTLQVLGILAFSSALITPAAHAAPQKAVKKSNVAKVAAKKDNQFRYIGIGLRMGYVWLMLHGLILLFLEGQVLFYDLLLHTFFLGFTFSMI